MVHYDDNFEPYWLDEKNWLVEIIMLPKDEDLSADLKYMGKLLAFSLITNTRMIAQIGNANEDIPAYELWFSFTSPGPGSYRWQCFVPCGLGFLYGNGGPMSTLGYMDGFMQVAA